MGSFHSRLASRDVSSVDVDHAAVSRKPRYYLALDVQTTSEDMPQIVSIEAAMYALEPWDWLSNAGRVLDKNELMVQDSDGLCLRKLGEMSAIVKPRHGYAEIRHMQDVRYHGVTLEAMAEFGEDASDAVDLLLSMVADATGYRLDNLDGPRVTVLSHGAPGMLSNFTAAARIDETLHPFWDELEALYHDSEDTLPLAAQRLPKCSKHTLEHSMAALGLGFPENRALAVAKLYGYLKRRPVMNE